MKPIDITLLLTRPRPASDRFARQLAAATGPFAEVIVSPLLRIVPSGAVPPVPPWAELAFTSENAVTVAAPHLPAGRRAWCVGDRTADAARAAGLDAVSAGGDAAALAALLARDPPGGEILHLSGAHQRGDLVERLAAAGLPARRVAIYDQVPAPLGSAARRALGGRRPVLLPLFSPRSAALAGEQAAGAAAPLLLAALSPAVASAWTGPEARAAITAERPDAGALAAAVSRLIAGVPGA